MLPELEEEKIQIFIPQENLPHLENKPQNQQLESILNGDYLSEINKIIENIPAVDLDSYLYNIIAANLPPMSPELEKTVFLKRDELKYKIEDQSVSDEIKANLELQIDNISTFIIYSNLKLIMSYYRKYGKGLNFTDAMQAGCEGIQKALTKFDITRGFKFSTYATWWIRQMVTREKIKNLPIRLAYNTHDKIFGMFTILEQQEAFVNRPLTLDEERAVLVQHFKPEIVDVFLKWRDNNDPLSYDDTDRDEETLSEKIPSEELVPEIYDRTNKDYSYSFSLIFSRNLTPQQKIVVFLRYGFYDGKPYDISDISKVLDCTPQNVYAILNGAIGKLKGEANKPHKISPKELQTKEEVINHISRNLVFTPANS